jgi:hypothetical protein
MLAIYSLFVLIYHTPLPYVKLFRNYRGGVKYKYQFFPNLCATGKNLITQIKEKITQILISFISIF